MIKDRNATVRTVQDIRKQAVSVLETRKMFNIN